MKPQSKRAGAFSLWARLAPWVLCLLALSVVVLYTLVLILKENNMWDDSFMFVRYAHNLLSYGMISWDGIHPTYGLTSLAHLFLVLPFAALFSNPSTAAIAGSSLGFLLFLLSAFFLVRAVVAKEPGLLPLCLATVASALALGHSSLSIIISSGMDTMTGVAYLCAYLAVLVHITRKDKEYNQRYFIAAGILGGCAYLVRPDLLIYSVVIPLAYMIWSDDSMLRRNAGVLLGVTIGTVLVLLGVAWAYFGTPLPLPFYAKSGMLYDPILAQRYTFIPILQLITHIDAFTLLWLALPVSLVVWRREFLRRTPHALYIGIMLSICAVTAYFLFFVLQIMPYVGRFYYPVLPGLIVLLVVLMARGWSVMQATCSKSIMSVGVLAICAVFAAILFAPFIQASEYAAYAVVYKKSNIQEVLHGTILDYYESHADLSSVWPCLNVVSNLPPTVSIATTEVGMPSALTPMRPVLDLAGLNDTQIGLGRINVGQAVESAQSDIVYMPSKRDYPAMYAALLSQPWFQAGYTIYPATSTGILFDVAVRRASVAAAPLTACMQKFHMPLPHTDDFYYITLPFLL